MSADPARLVLGDSNACFDIVCDLGRRPAVVGRPGHVHQERQVLLRTAIEFIHRQHGSGSPWACYVGPADGVDAFETHGVGAGRWESRRTM
jgi:hypothetical protein